MQKKLFRLFSFAVTIAALVAVLKIADWLPHAIQDDGMRRYGTLEEARSKLKIRDIYVPSYFPQGFITWPPSEILAQNRPFTAVIMEFRQVGKGDTALIITQSASAAFVPGGKLEFSQIRETTAHKLKGKEALLEVGACRRGEPCSRISWNEGRYRMSIFSKYPPIELIRIAESMAH